jgi:hypothetical protein
VLLVLDSTVYETVETDERRGLTVPGLPVPPPEVTLIQETFEVAVKVQPICVVTSKVPLPAFELKDALAGDSV